jgi:hypothetical protein
MLRASKRLRELLLFKIDLLVSMLRNAGTDLRRCLSSFGHCVSVEGLLSASRALSAVIAFVATPQAGVAESPVAATVARELIEHSADLRGLLVDVYLPGILKVFASKLRTRKDWRESRDLQRSSRVVCRNFIGRI